MLILESSVEDHLIPLGLCPVQWGPSQATPLIHSGLIDTESRWEAGPPEFPSQLRRSASCCAVELGGLPHHPEPLFLPL